MDSTSKTTVANVPKQQPGSDLRRFAVIAGGVLLIGGAAFAWAFLGTPEQPTSNQSNESGEAIIDEIGHRVRLKAEIEGIPRYCPECRGRIRQTATRCPHCQGEIGY